MTEMSSSTCDLNTNQQMSADFYKYFIKHKKTLNSENSHPINKKDTKPQIMVKVLSTNYRPGREETKTCLSARISTTNYTNCTQPNVEISQCLTASHLTTLEIFR